MLPEVRLSEVVREDVYRVAWWLEDEEVSSRWFGHYACGDPVHRGYEPASMLEASAADWDRVFRHDRQRFIFSIHDVDDAHIGECQLLLDEEGGAELSLLIGRKDLWHHGYGTSAVIALLDQAFSRYGLNRAWVSVPEDNEPASGLFEKLGFHHTETKSICGRLDESGLKALILQMNAVDHKARHTGGSTPNSMPVITVAGLPGSGAEAVGLEIARITGSRFVDDEIPRRMGKRLRRSVGELESLESSHSSLWRRMVRAFEASSASEGVHGREFGYVGWWGPEDYHDSRGYITAEEYIRGLKGVITELVREGSVVLNGNGVHLFVPPHIPSLRLLVTAPEESRRRRVAVEQGLDAKEAKRQLKRSDRDALTVARNLFGADLLDVSSYDLVLSLGRMSVEDAAGMVVGARMYAASTAGSKMGLPVG